MNLKRMFAVWGMQFLLAISLLAMSQSADAGKHAYPEFLPTVAHEAREILKKHGLPVADNREGPWFGINGIPGSYTIWLHKSDEIPQQAVLDIVKLCIDFYEQQGRKERFRIVMYHESKDEWRNSLFLGIGALAGVKPYFELTIGEKE